MNPRDPKQSIYDYPLYYDILFGWNRDAEADFYDAVLRHHGAPMGGCIVEIGCGTGQVAVRLAKRGWNVIGLDKRPDMLVFLQKAASDAGVAVHVVCADMTNFTLHGLQDGAYCPMSSFRILSSDQAALFHLQSAAKILRPGSTYILDMWFDDPNALGSTGTGGWTMRQGNIQIRTEDEKILVHDADHAVQMTLDWGEEGTLRKYSSAKFIDLIRRSGALIVEAWHPEARKTEDGISIFDIQHRKEPPLIGRVMVVLKHVAKDR